MRAVKERPVLFVLKVFASEPENVLFEGGIELLGQMLRGGHWVDLRVVRTQLIHVSASVARQSERSKFLTFESA